ncbi:hypothetical protein H1C71_020664, partial [Ictidomys tridecemlineatus]
SGNLERGTRPDSVGALLHNVHRDICKLTASPEDVQTPRPANRLRTRDTPSDAPSDVCTQKDLYSLDLYLEGGRGPKAALCSSGYSALYFKPDKSGSLTGIKNS